MRKAPFGFYFLWVVVAGIMGCRDDKKQDTAYKTIDYADTDSAAAEDKLFSLLDSSSTGISFINPVNETEQINILTYEYLYNGGGVAAGDINNDGLLDLYFTGNMVPNKLYLNLGNFTFKDITASAGVDGGIGYKTGVTMADVNGDGHLDIYVCKSMLSDAQYRRNVLYINNGNLTFLESAAAYGIDDPSFSTQGYFFDMDTDGDLDLYLLNHPYNLMEGNNLNVSLGKDGKPEVVKSADLTYISDKIYENEDGHFTDISKEAGILNEAFGLSAVIGDFNNDLKPDVYVCNDYVKPDYLYINNGNNTFTESFSAYFRHSSFSSMGSDYADLNNDGCPDLMIADMTPRDNYRQKMLAMVQNFDKFQRMTELDLKAQYSMNTLQLSDCNGNFSDIAFLSNTAYTDWSWSVLMADFDNDGWKDIFVSNGYKRDITNNDYVRYTIDSLKKQHSQQKITMMDWIKAIPQFKTPSYFFRNNRNLGFRDVSASWNSGPPALSNGAVYADLDNDGYLDMVVNNMDEPAFVLKNEGQKNRQNNFIRFSPVGEKGQPVWGTQVKIFNEAGSFQVHQLSPARGFLSSAEPVIHFGLGKSAGVSRAEIIWPDGKTQVIENPEINKLNRVEKKPTGKYEMPRGSREIFFSAIPEKMAPEMTHQENAYIDFKREPLLHHKFSEEGPAASTADVNGDGLDDVFIGGAEGFSGNLFIQKKNGSFTRQPNPVFEQDKSHEDVASLFFDANGDGHQDLMVISGGNEQPANSPHYEDRLYLNDGKGNFTKSDGLPSLPASGGTVAAGDIDRDGDPDLFIGGRISPGQYPVAPSSNLLRNDKGRFVDVTQEWSAELANPGMITDAKFADLDKDGAAELILAGEWMPVMVFKNQNGTFTNITESMGLSSILGWWYTLCIADINNDGYPEIIAGNLGLNSHIRASVQKPVTLHYKDFDNNGSMDPVICCYNPHEKNNRSYPLHYRDRMLDQMIMLKKKFTRYSSYANSTLNDIFTPEQLKDAKTLTANTLSHTVFINNAGKSITPVALPRYTQLSVLRSVVTTDINRDGKPDLLVGGNLYGTDAQFGRYDASVGAVLLGNGKGGFDVVGPEYSGFSIPGNTRNILLVRSSAGISVLVTRNNERSSLFRLK